MERKSYINPQPAAVERENKNSVNKKPTNLAGSELGKTPEEKKKRAIQRNKNRNPQN